MSTPDRAAAVAQLRAAYDRGQLDRHSFDERVSNVLKAASQEQLDRLVADVPRYATSAPAFEPYPRGVRHGATEDALSDPLPHPPMAQPHWSVAKPSHDVATHRASPVRRSGGLHHRHPTLLAVVLLAVPVLLLAAVFGIADFGVWISVFLLLAFIGQVRSYRRD